MAMNKIEHAASEALTDIFRTVGQPTVTYVERAEGQLEKDLNGAISENGQLCLICGPSKTGKTTLYREVLRRRQEVPLVVRCDRSLTAEKVWLRALEEVDFDRVRSRSTTIKVAGTIEGEVSAKLGWRWLAEASARLKGTATAGRDEAVIREKVLAEPGADLLIPILKDTSYRLVVEYFHYLDEEQKVILFEQWKRFTDNEISVIVLGTTHRAIDIANSNKDLIGRITQLNIGHWGSSDLRKVAGQGFKYLDISVSSSCLNTLASEAVGLPIIVQQACLALVTADGSEFRSQVRGQKDVVTPEKISKNLHAVAKKRYAQFEDNYKTIVKGPREKARRYRTYELVLSCFQLDPIKFALEKNELIERIGRLGLDNSERPPNASINSTLSALTKFQATRGLELLEWRPKQTILHITEPAFLFYVRWRTKRKAAEPISQRIAELLADFEFKTTKASQLILKMTLPSNGS